jgi:pyruvate dehydrogenase E1 component alpha subunit
MPAWDVDGMDVLAVEDATHRAADIVRSGEGPCFLEYRTYRFRAHSMYDPELYRSKEEVGRWKERDPIEALAAKLRDDQLLQDDEFGSLEDTVATEIEDAIAFADAGTDEPVEELTRFVYSEDENR